MTDNPAQTGREFMRNVGDDPGQWADAMMQSAEREGYVVDREWLLRWLGDAIDAGRRSKLPPINPEGGA
jgi:hypothetical protein